MGENGRKKWLQKRADQWDDFERDDHDDEQPSGRKLGVPFEKEERKKEKIFIASNISFVRMGMGSIYKTTGMLECAIHLDGGACLKGERGETGTGNSMPGSGKKKESHWTKSTLPFIIDRAVRVRVCVCVCAADRSANSFKI